MSGWSRKLFATAALLGLWSACAKREPAAATHAASAPPQILRISQRNEPADLDPARVTLPDEFFVIRALSEGLLTPNPDGSAPLPAAAERFDVSANGLTYTFHLRDARWSNGEPVTAADFIASYRRALTPATAAPKANVFYPVKNARAFLTGAVQDFAEVGFRAPDARTLIVTLEKPTPRFPFYVASGPWIPVNPRAVEKFGRTWTQPDHFVGNGPFTLIEWRPHQRIVVKKNPGYRAAAAVHLTEIQFLHFDDGDAEERAYRAGQIDVTMDVPRTKLETYARERPAELHRIALAETRFLTFNTQRPPLNDPRVRRALSFAIDRKKIVDHVLLGGQTEANHFLPVSLDAPVTALPSLWGHTFHPETARRLFAEAGFPNGQRFPKFEVTAWSRSQVATLESMQAMWREHLGIEVSIAIREAKVHLGAVANGDYDVAFLTTLIDVPDAALMLAEFSTGDPANSPKWSDAEYDKLVGSLAATRDPSQRALIELNASDRLLEESPVAPLYFNTHHWLQSPRVHGWREDALWTRFYTGVSIDP